MQTSPKPLFLRIQSSWTITSNVESVAVDSRRSLVAVAIPAPCSQRYTKFFRSKTGRIVTLLLAIGNLIGFVMVIVMISPLWISTENDYVYALFLMASFVVPYTTTISFYSVDMASIVLKQFDSWFFLVQIAVLCYCHGTAQAWGVKAPLAITALVFGGVTSVLADTASDRTRLLPGFLLAGTSHCCCLYFIQQEVWSPLATATFDFFGVFKPVNLASLMLSATITLILFLGSFLAIAFSDKRQKSRVHHCSVMRFGLRRGLARRNSHIQGDPPLTVTPGILTCRPSLVAPSGESSASLVSTATSTVVQQKESTAVRSESGNFLSPGMPKSGGRQAGGGSASERVLTAKTRNVTFSNTIRLTRKPQWLQSCLGKVSIFFTTLFSLGSLRALLSSARAMPVPGGVANQPPERQQPKAQNVDPKISQQRSSAVCDAFCDVFKTLCVSLFVFGNILLVNCVLQHYHQIISTPMQPTSIVENAEKDSISTMCLCEADGQYTSSFVLILLAAAVLLHTHTNKFIASMLLRSFQAKYLAISVLEFTVAAGLMLGPRRRTLGALAVSIGFVSWVLLCDAIFLSAKRRTAVCVCLALQLVSEIAIGVYLFSAHIGIDDTAIESVAVMGFSVSTRSVAMEGLATMVIYTGRALYTAIVSPLDFILLHSFVEVTSRRPSHS